MTTFHNLDWLYYNNQQIKMERTFIMVKPDGVQRGLVGQIISRFEQKGYFLKGIKMLVASEALLG